MCVLSHYEGRQNYATVRLLYVALNSSVQGRKPVMSIGGDLISALCAEKIFLRPPQNLNLGGDELSNTKL